MISVTATLQKLAIDKSAHLAPMARTALAVCQDCEQECRKHADKHAVCKACADSCANTNTAPPTHAPIWMSAACTPAARGILWPHLVLASSFRIGAYLISDPRGNLIYELGARFDRS